MPKKRKPSEQLKELFPPSLGIHPQESLQDLLTRLKIPQSGAERYDLLLIGDGSGCDWRIGAGWGCVSIERLHEAEPMVWFGAMNRGTVNLAEMLAYVPPLTWYAARPTKLLTRNVHIITDSEYCKNTGTNNHALVQANGPLWQIFAIFQRYGLLLHWHWCPREDVALNVYVDALSKSARLSLEASDPQAVIEHSPDGQVHRGVQEYNVW